MFSLNCILKKPPPLLKALLGDFLPLPRESIIEDIEILDAEEISKENAKEKKKFILDLKVRLCRNQSGEEQLETVNVEMQATRKENFTNRMLAYAARIYSGQIDKGEDYDQLRPVYSLVFSKVNLQEFKTTKEYCHICTLQRNCPPYLAFSHGMQFIIIELEKFSKQITEIVDQNQAWCYLLRNSQDMDAKDCEQLKQKGKIMPQAVESLWNLSQDELAQEILEAEEKQRRDKVAEMNYAKKEAMAEGHSEGLAKGLAKGREEGQKEIALDLLARGMNIQEISAITKLSLTQVRKLNPRE